MNHAKFDFSSLGPVIVAGLVCIVFLIIAVPPILVWLLFQMILPFLLWLVGWIFTLALLWLFFHRK